MDTQPQKIKCYMQMRCFTYEENSRSSTEKYWKYEIIYIHWAFKTVLQFYIVVYLNIKINLVHTVMSDSKLFDCNISA